MFRQNGSEPMDRSSNGTEHEEEEKEPVSTQFNTSNFGNFLEVDKDKLTVRYTGQGAHNNDVGAIQGDHAAPRHRRVYYYEIHINETGERGLIGLGFADKAFKMGKQPGWEPNSHSYHGHDGKRCHGNGAMWAAILKWGDSGSRWEPNSYGYHGDDGKKFHANGAGEDYGPLFSSGDVVGAGIHIGRQEIFFTKNGKYLGVAFRNIANVPLFPTIGLHSLGECVSVNFGQHPFKFSVEAMIQEEDERQDAAVQGIAIPAGVTHRLVRNYLLHYGYANTLRAFDSAAGVSPDADSQPSSSSSQSDEERAAGSTLDLRHAVRQHFMAGQVDEVAKLLRLHLPRMLEAEGGESKPDLDVYFHVNAMNFIELIRADKIEEAVSFAQSSLAPLRSLLSSRRSVSDVMLHEVVALLAYENPMETSLSRYMHFSQRETSADVVNASILVAGSTEKRPVKSQDSRSSLPQAALERLLQQLVAVQNEWQKANGGFGEPFKLEHHLLPASPSKSAQSAHTAQHSNGNSAPAPMERD